MIGEFITRSEFEYRKYVQTLGISESDEIYGFGFKCYLQGINNNFKVVEEIALPEIAKRIEDDQFIAYIKNLLEHPEQMAELPENNGTVVEVITKCSDAKGCICFPDRCPAIDCNDEMCHQKVRIDISKNPEETYLN